MNTFTISPAWEPSRGSSSVILENHLHLIAASENLSHDMQRFKSYTAKQIIAHLEQRRSVKLLELLAFFKRAHK